jgi:hypothetical protein
MKRILLLSLGAGMTALIFSSYATGPFAGGAGNRTGSAGTSANCSTGGCHATSSASTLCSLVVQTTSGGTVTAYTPGVTYKVIVGGGTIGTAFPKFGFQASAVKASATSTQAGSFTSTAGNISVRPAGALQLVEHNTPIAGASVSGAMTYTASFNWTAPASGTGTVRFYAMVNAVNGDNATSGDQPGNGVTIDLPQGPGAGVQNVSAEQLSIYPNPVTDALNMKLGSVVGSCEVRIVNFTGSVVADMTVSVKNGEASINTANLKPGTYYVMAQQGDAKWGTSFVKQ